MQVHRKSRKNDGRPAACFDFDGTLTETLSGSTFARGADDWRWMSPSVPQKLNDLGSKQKGYRVIIFTNQRSRFKEATVLAAVNELEIDVDVYIAFDVKVKKPKRAMYEEAFQSKRHPEGSFYVADALGRPGDWSDVDRRFAEACGLPVYSPEEFFGLAEEKEKESTSRDIHHGPVGSSHAVLQASDLVRDDMQELVILVGRPASGKSRVSEEFTRDNTGTEARYLVLHGDDPSHRTESKFLRAVVEGLRSGKSVVVDATNGTAKKRAKFCEAAKKAVRGPLLVRCLWLDTPLDICRVRNKVRPQSQQVPPVAYAAYEKRFEQPSSHSEECIDLVERITPDGKVIRV